MDNKSRKYKRLFVAFMDHIKEVRELPYNSQFNFVGISKERGKKMRNDPEYKVTLEDVKSLVAKFGELIPLALENGIDIDLDSRDKDEKIKYLREALEYVTKDRDRLRNMLFESEQGQ